MIAYVLSKSTPASCCETRHDEAIRATAGQMAALKPKSSVRAVRLRLARERLADSDLLTILAAVKSHQGSRPLIVEFVGKTAPPSNSPPTTNSTSATNAPSSNPSPPSTPTAPPSRQEAFVAKFPRGLHPAARSQPPREFRHPKALRANPYVNRGEQTRMALT